MCLCRPCGNILCQKPMTVQSLGSGGGSYRRIFTGTSWCGGFLHTNRKREKRKDKFAPIVQNQCDILQLVGVAEKGEGELGLKVDE